MESIAGWQSVFLGGIASWVVISSILKVTRKLRSLTQPWVSHHVFCGTPITLKIQRYQHRYLDALFSGLSCIVSVPFYTGFLPLLFWSGHCKLARQMTLLMAFCDYMGNCIKDVVSAPRPSSPPVRRVTATADEKENALEYGLPSSHTLNTVCLSGFLLHYVLSYTQNEDLSTELAGLAIICLLVGLIGLGRIYLGMHSLIDIIGGLAIGLAILAFWLSVHNYLDSFIVSGQNGLYYVILLSMGLLVGVQVCGLHPHLKSSIFKLIPSINLVYFSIGGIALFDQLRFSTHLLIKVPSFWTALTFLLLFAYPTPELPTPSFEYHTAFNGVALGIVIGVQQTYHLFHHEDVPRIFTQLSFSAFVGRMLVGIPAILLVKYCSKVLAKRMLPMLANALSIPIRSTSYIPTLCGSNTSKNSNETKQAGYVLKLFFSSQQDSFDVDTGIRLLQYTGLAWAVVDLVPSLFTYLQL